MATAADRSLARWEFLQEHGDRMTNHPRIAPLSNVTRFVDEHWVAEAYPMGEWPTPRVVSGWSTWLSITRVPPRPLWRRLLDPACWRGWVYEVRWRLSDWIAP